MTLSSKPSNLTDIISYLTNSAESTSEQSQHSFLLDNIPQIVFLIDNEYRWELLNPRWESLTGFQRQDCLKSLYSEYIHPEDRDHLHNYFVHMQPGRRDNSSVEARLLTRRSDPRWTEINAVQVIASSGQPVIIGTIADISERIAEEEQLHASNRSLSGLLNDLSGMVYRCRNDKYWTMEYISGGCKELTGYSPSDMINNSKLSWDSLIHPEDHDMVWAEVQNGVRDSRFYDMTFRMLTIDKKVKWVWERGKGIFSDDGELLGLEGVITDVTETKLRQNRIEDRHLYNSVGNLTQLPLFKDRLARAILASQSLTGFRFNLMIIQFHRLADALEQCGSNNEAQVTKTITTRIDAVVNDLDSITDLKFDRFAILVERPLDQQSLNTLAQQLLETMRAPIQLENQSLFLTCSIGASNNQFDNDNVEAVMNTALVAMDFAAAQGGSRFEQYDPRVVEY